MNVPFCFFTPQAARLALLINEKDYQQFVEAAYSPASGLSGDGWHFASLIFLADLLIAAGEKIKQFTAQTAPTSFQPRQELP